MFRFRTIVICALPITSYRSGDRKTAFLEIEEKKLLRCSVVLLPWVAVVVELFG